MSDQEKVAIVYDQLWSHSISMGFVKNIARSENNFAVSINRSIGIIKSFDDIRSRWSVWITGIKLANLVKNMLNE